MTRMKSWIILLQEWINPGVIFIRFFFVAGGGESKLECLPFIFKAKDKHSGLLSPTSLTYKLIFIYIQSYSNIYWFIGIQIWLE